MKGIIMNVQKRLAEVSNNRGLLFHLGRAKAYAEKEGIPLEADEILEEIQRRKASGAWDYSIEDHQVDEYLGYIKGMSTSELEELKEGLHMSRRLGAQSPEVLKEKEEAVEHLLRKAKKKEQRKAS